MRIIGCNWILWERTQSATFIVRQVTCEIMGGLAILRVFLAVFVMYSLKRNTYFHLIMGWTFRILVAIFLEIEFTWYKNIGKRCCKHARKIWSRSSYFVDSVNKYTWVISFLQDGENAKKRANSCVIVTFIHGTRVLWSKV